MLSSARLAIIGVLGLALGSCSRPSPMIVFNATDFPMKLGWGSDEVIPPRGFLATTAHRSIELVNHEGGIAFVDPDDMPEDRKASDGGVTSVVIDEKTSFFKRRRPSAPSAPSSGRRWDVVERRVLRTHRGARESDRASL